jgi:hypothetical protein
MQTQHLIDDFKDNQNRTRCRYTMLGGARCGSPALRGTTLCYFHSEQRGTPDQVRERKARHHSIIMPLLKTRSDIQEALGNALSAIAGGDIDPRRAGLILYCLQIASTNLTEHQNNYFRELPEKMQHLSDDAEEEIAQERKLESQPHYGTGPQPQFAPDGGPISVTPDYVSAERKAHDESIPDFTPRPGQWNKITPSLGLTLLEELGRHHGSDQPLSGTPARRRPHSIETPAATPIVQTLSEETEPMVIAAMQATASKLLFLHPSPPLCHSERRPKGPQPRNGVPGQLAGWGEKNPRILSDAPQMQASHPSRIGRFAK